MSVNLSKITPRSAKQELSVSYYRYATESPWGEFELMYEAPLWLQVSEDVRYGTLSTPEDVAWLVMPVHWIRDEHTYIMHQYSFCFIFFLSFFKIFDLVLFWFYLLLSIINIGCKDAKTSCYWSKHSSVKNTTAEC